MPIPSEDKEDARMLEELDTRFRHIVWAMSALPTAALLRHGLHVYCGISREDIRLSALIAAGVVTAAIILSLKLSRRR
jgi:hypothetical protein